MVRGVGGTRGGEGGISTLATGREEGDGGLLEVKRGGSATSSSLSERKELVCLGRRRLLFSFEAFS